LIIHGLSTPDNPDETDMLVNTKNPEAMKPAVESPKSTEETTKEPGDDRIRTKWYEGLLNKTKEFFEATPDQDFL